MDDLSPIDRREVIKASVVLPRDERRPWLRNIEQSAYSKLELWIIKWAAAKR